MAKFSGNELVIRGERRCELAAAQFDTAVLGPGQLLVETRYSLISQGTELANFTGLDSGTRRPGSWNYYPYRPGYAAISTVVARGPDADSRFAVGDTVFSITKHARYAVADPAARPVVGLRPDDDHKNLLLCRMAAIALTALRKASSVDLGGRAVVVGLGLVGYFAAQLLRRAGMDVLATDPAAGRREAARGGGVRAAAIGGTGDLRALVPSWTDGPDLVIEATGHPGALRLAFELVRDGGEVVLLGTPRGSAQLDATELMSAIHYRGLRLVGALEWLLPVHSERWSARWSLYDSYHTLVQFFRDGDIGLGGWQIDCARPEDAQAVYTELADGPQTARAVVFDWTCNGAATAA